MWAAKLIDENKISGFNPISLEEMGKVKLMNRIDTKFVTTVGQVEELLARACDDYFIQQIEGSCDLPYYTCYYDTRDTDMFYQHQRGKKTRQKVRIRQYEAGEAPPFLEIKSKNNKGRTKKKRVAMEEGPILNKYNDFLLANSDYPCDILNPCIENHFYRITLVNRDMTERITIDTGLEFHNLQNDNRLSLDNIGIIEWKRDGQSPVSGLQTILRDLRIGESGFSKYCIGMAITDPSLRQNKIKKRLRYIQKLSPFSITGK